ncbi:MAG: peptidase MA family metallohydrolase [Elusimicrobiota bacterium]|nr:peptidase MA family metallohydrolase [Elusimicrobiota bacterium]
MRCITALFCLFIAAGASGAELATAPSVSNWHVKTSPHFEILHESVWSPSSISLELEKIFASMRLKMAMFAPWMVKEKSRIYIYASQDSYVNGEFNPPRWSKGLAYSSKKTVVVYDTGDILKLKAVIAHELSHLYFEGYFGEKLKYPPQWLNEGLAVYLEESVSPEGGPWSRALAYFPPERQVVFPGFFSLKIDQLKSEARISDWYLQAYGTVLYLYRPHTRVQFKAFCEALRTGEKVETALWKGYRVREGADFGNKWSVWLESYSPPGSSLKPGGASASFDFKPVQFSSFSFTNFGSKK